MKNIILALSTIFIFSQCAKKTAETVQSVDKSWRKTAPAPAPARDIQLGTYTAFDLDNGLKVIVVENHKLPRVSFQLSLNNDALIEGLFTHKGHPFSSLVTTTRLSIPGAEPT